jgi:hypothetical protein
MPPFEAQPRIINQSLTGKAESFRHVRRQSRAPRFFRDPSHDMLTGNSAI